MCCTARCAVPPSHTTSMHRSVLCGWCAVRCTLHGQEHARCLSSYLQSPTWMTVPLCPATMTPSLYPDLASFIVPKQYPVHVPMKVRVLVQIVASKQAVYHMSGCHMRYCYMHSIAVVMHSIDIIMHRHHHAQHSSGYMHSIAGAKASYRIISNNPWHSKC